MGKQPLHSSVSALYKALNCSHADGLSATYGHECT